MNKPIAHDTNKDNNPKISATAISCITSSSLYLRRIFSRPSMMTLSLSLFIIPLPPVSFKLSYLTGLLYDILVSTSADTAADDAAYDANCNYVVIFTDKSLKTVL